MRINDIASKIEEVLMNIYENLVVVDDEEGQAFICTLDHKLSELFWGLDRERKIPHKLKELSKHERSSCTRFFGKSLQPRSSVAERR